MPSRVSSVLLRGLAYWPAIRPTLITGMLAPYVRTAAICRIVLIRSRMLSAVADANVSAQSPPCRTNAFPSAASASLLLSTLSSSPPLVFAGDCDVLKSRLSDAALGKAFVLQGGDCAETFASATADNIRDRIKTILQMAAVLTYGASMPVIKVGRIAGQYAKPRSSTDETRDGITLPAYRGD